MTTYLNNYKDSIYSTNIYDHYNGVLKISTGTSYGTGNLLYDGRSVLTAAHVFDGMDYDDIKIYIYDGVKNFTLNAKVTIYDNYDDLNINGDLAIVTFKTNLDELYNRYDIYRNSDEISQNFTALGYGDVGNGTSGFVDSSTIYKLKTTNTFDADLKTLMDYSNTNISWRPLSDLILIADFDNGNASTDIIGYLSNNQNLGTGNTEGLIAPGDSGGAAFINNLIAGIASYTTKISNSNNSVGDINNFLDSSFGEIGAYQRISQYQEWIDKTIRTNYLNAPTSKDEVKLMVKEDDTYAYFMVEFLPLRNTINDIVSVDYTTLDGTAKAGEDFILSFGTLNIYEDESYAIIAVELINDYVIENNEYFYLEISNPINGTFGDGVLTLTAMRTIIDDDII